MLGVDFTSHLFKLTSRDYTNKLFFDLPYNFFIGNKDEGIIYLKPGALMRCYSFVCPDLGSSSAGTINAISNYFNESLKRLGTGWAVHFESRREYTKKYPGSTWENKLGYLIDSRRKDIFQNQKEHFVNYYFLTLTHVVKPDIVSKGHGLLYKSNENGQDYYNLQNVEKEIQLFRDLTEETISYISSRLYIKPLDNNEACNYIKSSLSTKWRKQIAPTEMTFFDNFITDESLKTGSCIKIGDKYCPIVAVRDFPTETYPAILDVLNKAEIEYRWSTRWIGMDKVKSAKIIEKSQKRFNNARKSWGQAFVEAAGNVSTDRVDPSAIAFEEETNEAKVALSKDMISCGYYTSCVEVWDEDYDTAMDKASYIVSLINSCGFGARIEGANSYKAWLGMLPGNNYSNVRKEMLTSANVAHIIPLSSLWTGDFYNSYTKGRFGNSAPLLTASSYGSPFFINLNVGDLFHSFIFGPSGAGKSTFLCLLEASWTRYKNGRVIVLDKDKTSRGVCIGAGGNYVEPGADGVAFQPLRELETETDLIWATEFIELCLTQQHLLVDAKMKEEIRTALVQLRDTKEPETRDMTSFQMYVQSEEIKVAIEPYTLDGQYGSIFDARNTNIQLSKFVMIEMGILMKLGTACVTPALMYIFKFIESMFAKENDDKGHPTLLVMDEAWVFLDNPYFAKTIDNWLRTLRKKHVAVVFATQDVPSVAKSSISTSILTNCQTRFFLADPNANSDMLADYYSAFGLSRSEINALANARQKRDYFYKSPNGARMFQLDLDPFQLSILNPSKEVLDGLETKYGRNSSKELIEEILYQQGFGQETKKYMNKYGNGE